MAGEVVNANFATDAAKTNAGLAETALNRKLTGTNAMESLATADQNRQLQQLQEEYPEFPDALELLQSSMRHAEECWQQRRVPVPSAGPLLPTESGNQ